MAEEKKVEETKVEPKVVFKYVVTRYDNGLSSIDGLPIGDDETATPSIDQYHAAKDIIDLGVRLDHQLILEEAEARVLRRLQDLAAEGEAEATQEETK